MKFLRNFMESFLKKTDQSSAHFDHFIKKGHFWLKLTILPNLGFPVLLWHHVKVRARARNLAASPATFAPKFENFQILRKMRKIYKFIKIYKFYINYINYIIIYKFI